MRRVAGLSLVLCLLAGSLSAQNHAHAYYKLLRVVRAPTCARSDSLIGTWNALQRPAVVRGTYRQEVDSTLLYAVDPIVANRRQRFWAMVQFPGWLPDSLPSVEFALLIQYTPHNTAPLSTDSMYASLGDAQYVGVGVPKEDPRKPGTPDDVPVAYVLSLSATQFTALAQAQHPSFRLGKYQWNFNDAEQASFRALFRAAACSLDPTNH